MQHWTEQYVGKPYVEGQNDCASFAARVQAEVFHRAITLPGERAPGMRGQSGQILAHKNDHGIPVEIPMEGDAVLMIGRGRLNHIGVYTVIHGVPYVLHAMKSARQVCLHRIRDLQQQGLAVEGYYQWITR